VSEDPSDARPYDVVAAVDVGGTTIKAAIVAAGGRIVHRRAAPTPVADGPDAVVEALLGEVRALVTHTQEAGSPSACGIGVVVPGFVDAAAGIARFAANIGWRDVSLRDLIAQETGISCTVEHDVRAAGIAEAAVGRVAGLNDALLAVIGTGVAAVLFSAGRRVSGARQLAGELGHIPIWPDGELCPCGQRGCLERYASAGAIVRRYEQATGRFMTAEEIVALAEHDEAAGTIWRQAITALATGLASCTMLLDPAVIVIGGGLSGAGEALRAPVSSALGTRVVWRVPPPVEISPLGADAGLLGAAILAADVGGVPGLINRAPNHGPGSVPGVG
jgi:glucokinase